MNVQRYNSFVTTNQAMPEKRQKTRQELRESIEQINLSRQGKSISPAPPKMIMPKQYLDVFQHYPALRDISDSAYKTHYQNSIARDGMKGNAKIKLAL